MCHRLRLKAGQFYLYSTFHTPGPFSVLYRAIKYRKVKVKGAKYKQVIQKIQNFKSKLAQFKSLKKNKTHKRTH